MNECARDGDAVEAPAPGGAFCYPGTRDGPDGGAQQGHQRVDGDGGAALVGGPGVAEDAAAYLWGRVSERQRMVMWLVGSCSQIVSCALTSLCAFERMAAMNGTSVDLEALLTMPVDYDPGSLKYCPVQYDNQILEGYGVIGATERS